MKKNDQKQKKNKLSPNIIMIVSSGIVLFLIGVIFGYLLFDGILTDNLNPYSFLLLGGFTALFVVMLSSISSIIRRKNKQ